jgi:hypothetical protein
MTKKTNTLVESPFMISRKSAKTPRCSTTQSRTFTISSRRYRTMNNDSDRLALSGNTIRKKDLVWNCMMLLKIGGQLIIKA